MADPIPSLPLMQRRKLLGYAIPAVNIPLFIYIIYLIISHFQSGMIIGDRMFLEDIIALVLAGFLTFRIPRFFPVYMSKYTHTSEGLLITRFLREDVLLPYRDISRAEVYLRLDEDISEDSKEYANKQSETLRKSGFKFKDYTNSDAQIMNLFYGKHIYMLSPAKPKTVLKKLKHKNNKLTAKIVELTRRGKRIQELT